MEDPGPPCRWEMQLGGLEFLSTTDVRLKETWGARCLSGSAGSGKRRGGRKRRNRVPEGGTAFSPDALLHSVCRRGVDGSRFPLFFPLSFPLRLLFLGAYSVLLGQAWAEGKGELA